MAAPVITLPKYGNFGGFLVREANGYRSREQVSLADTAAGSGGAAVYLEDGAVLGRRAASAPTAAAPAPASGNSAGNATFGAVTADADARVGHYTIRMTSATAFVVEFDGNTEGTGATGSAFNGPINFTMTAGLTPQVAGDSWTVNTTKVAGSGEYGLHDPAASNGLQTPAGILLGRYRVDDGAKSAAIINADAEVQRARLVFPAGITTQQKDAAYAELAKLGIKFR